MRRLSGPVLVAALLVVGAGSCGDDDDGERGEQGNEAPGVELFEAVTGPFLRTSGSEDQLAPLIEAGCARLVVPRPTDSFSFNEYLDDLFGGDPTEPAPGIDPDRLDAAFLAACQAFDGDAAVFVADVSVGLGTDLDAFGEFLVEACARFREREAVNADDPRPLDPAVVGLLAEAGVDEADARAAIDAYCPS